MKRIKLYNVLTRKKEAFKPLRKDWVGLYACGPTVYNYAHLGNLRTYIFEDVLRRTLEYAGYKVRQVMNITDVEDKIIRDARKTGKTIFEFTKPYEKAFFEDIRKLNIQPAWKYPRATEHIKEMVSLISTLVRKGFAYQSDGSMYFDISKFRYYGRLSRLASREIKIGARVSADEYAKEDAQDFALWKAAAVGEPAWDAPFDKGRPGWHIECSAMSMKYLGRTFDVHAGGVDLVFPHHENEIAQSEGATGKKFVRYFVEGEHLLVKGQRMAKSLGNFYTLRDIEAKGYNPLAFRYLALTARYRSKLNFSWKSLAAAENSLERLYDFMRDLSGGPKHARSKPSFGARKLGLERKMKQRLEKALFNDLDAPKALAVIWDLIRAYNKNHAYLHPCQVRRLLLDFDRVLALGLSSVKSDAVPISIRRLSALREQYRAGGQWAKADEIRSKIFAAGYGIEDTPSGPQLKKMRQ